MANEIVLKPCPFCGGAAEIVEANIYLTKGWRVKCKTCKASSLPEYADSPHMTAFGPIETTRYTEEQAKDIVAERWNRRVSDG